MFTRENGAWSQQAYLKASNTDASDIFGRSVAISGNTVVVGASGESSNASSIDGDQTDNSTLDAGAAYVFTRENDAWSQQAYVKAFNPDEGDLFGTVAISGNTVAVGTLYESSNATDIDGDQTDNSARRAGAAFVYTIETPEHGETFLYKLMLQIK